MPARAALRVPDWQQRCATAVAVVDRAGLLGHDAAALRVQGAAGATLDLELSVTCVVGDHAPLWIILHRDVSARVAAEAHMLEHTLVEQLRLGVALHEGLGQDLTGASLLQSAVGRCADLAQRLSPFLLDRFGLVNALGDLVRRQNARSGCSIGFDVVGSIDVGIDSGTAYHVFGVAQSALELAAGQPPFDATRLSLRSHPVEGLQLRPRRQPLQVAPVEDYLARSA
jgi:signal transduction histidine kinase